MYRPNETNQTEITSPTALGIAHTALYRTLPTNQTVAGTTTYASQTKPTERITSP